MNAEYLSTIWRKAKTHLSKARFRQDAINVSYFIVHYPTRDAHPSSSLCPVEKYLLGPP